MDWSQYLFIALLLLATMTGQKRIAVMLWGNLIATIALTELMAGDARIAIAVADSVTAALLLSCGQRGQIIAAVYAVMIAIYPMTAFAGFAEATTYAIIDLLAIVQLAVFGRWDRGLGIALGAVVRGRSAFHGPVQDGNYAPRNSGIPEAQVQQVKGQG